jgi:hypothetical protein
MMHTTKRGGWRKVRDLRACSAAELEHMRQSPAVVAELNRRRDVAVRDNREAKARHAAEVGWQSISDCWLYVGAAMLVGGK